MDQTNNHEVLLNILVFRGEELTTLARKYGAKNLRVYGSVARREETDLSDVDLLVDMCEDASLLDLALLRIDLEDLLGRTVDITTEPALHPMLAEIILNEAVPL